MSGRGKKGVMNCKHFERKLIAYMDGKASEAERREVEQHISACAACHTRARDFAAVWGMMDALPAIEPSEAFDARLRARIAVEPVRRSFWAEVLPSPRFALSMSLLVLCSVWLANRAPASTPPANSEAEFKMINNLPVLENYDVLSKFDVLSDLPTQTPGANE